MNSLVTDTLWARTAPLLPEERKQGNILGPNPTDKGRAGCKHHLVVDGQGIPLAVRLTAANVNDCQLFGELLDAIPALSARGPIAESNGHPRS